MKAVLKKIPSLFAIAIIVAFLSGCVEHRYYAEHHRHTPRYYHRHNMPEPRVEVEIHN